MQRITPPMKATGLTMFFIVCLHISCSKTDLQQASSTTAVESKSNSGKAMRENAEVAIDWYNLQLAILLERNAATSTLNYAYIGVGLYETVRPGIRGAQSFYGKIRMMPKMPDPENNQGYDFVIAANAYLADITRHFFTGLTDANKTAIDNLETKWNAISSPGINSEIFTRSVNYGKAISAAMKSWKTTEDYVATNNGYMPPSGPGKWIPTPPAFAPLPVEPYAGKATTLLALAANTVSPPFPFEYSEDVNSDFYKAVKEVYDVSKTLTNEQKSTALFWVDQGNGIGYTPGGHDFKLVIQCMEQHPVTLDIAAEALAKAGIAQRDGRIVTFRSKYVYNLIRPVSYIRKNIDPAWSPFISTPNHPEYPAAHSGVTGTTLQAAARVLGENLPVTDRAYEFRGLPVKTFTSLLDASKDAGISRLYGGIHYTVSIDEGINIALNVGTMIGDINLK